MNFFTRRPTCLRLVGKDRLQTTEYWALRRILYYLTRCWIKGKFAMDRSGAECEATDERAWGFCLVGAIERSVFEAAKRFTLRPMETDALALDLPSCVRELVAPGIFLPLSRINDQLEMSLDQLVKPIAKFLALWEAINHGNIEPESSDAEGSGDPTTDDGLEDRLALDRLADDGGPAGTD